MPRSSLLKAFVTTSALLAAFALAPATGRMLPASAQEHWPQFRGPGAGGVGESDRLPVRWSETENIEWRQAIPGRGWSSPIVWGQRVFVTTAVSQGQTEEPMRGLYFGGNRPEPPADEYHWKVYCLDLESGRVLWDRVAHRGVPHAPIHLKNSYASETPATDGERVYCLFGNVGLYAYDFQGNLVWKHELPAMPIRFGWGTAASPIVYRGRVYLVNDNDADSYIAVFDARTGEELLRVERPDEKSNWATPFIWENELRTELVTAGTRRVRSYDLAGNMLWEMSGMSSIAIPTPLERFGLLYVGSGYVLDPVRPIFAVRPGATGDISLDLRGDDLSNEYIAWCNKTAGPYNPSFLVYGDLLYVLLDRGFFTCYDAHTGQEVYGKQRLPEGKEFTSSPWAYGGKVFCLDEYGKTFVIEAGPEYTLSHVNQLAEDTMCMATPAIVGDRLLLRTDRNLLSIRDASE